MTTGQWNDAKGIRRRLAQRPYPRMVSLDLEGRTSISAIGAVRTDSSRNFSWKGRQSELREALIALDSFVEGANCLVGHNIIEHDIPLLANNASDLNLLRLPAVDTLYLGPLARPANPYHHLVKQYKEPGLARVQTNDPLLDAELTLELLADILGELEESEPDLLVAWHALLAFKLPRYAFDGLFRRIRRVNATPKVSDVIPIIENRLAERGCPNCAREIVRRVGEHAFQLIYLLAWLPVSGGNSIIPPYVEHRFRPSVLADRLRATHCGERDCPWCSQRHNLNVALKRWFGHDDFREYPIDSLGNSLQKVITEEHLNRKHVLGILPTGSGKSLCYQLPALMRYEATGGLTVVISPLVALMADQVTAMAKNGIHCVTTINGLISWAERAKALSDIRLGDAGIVLVAPEQLRNLSFRNALDGRRVVAWVLDEAHCLSKWGHDFRPDYRYIARYIKEHHADHPAPILCLTATAKRDVVEEISSYFDESLQAPLEVVDGGAERSNLEFAVSPTTDAQRVEHIHKAIVDSLGRVCSGGAIVYCATKRSAEETAEALVQRGVSARFFHSGLSPENKREVQRDFHDGALEVVVATNAFGMGIDKPDVRVVVHAEIPGSLENYLQEAGRAGRDGEPARCLLLFADEDPEKQFSLTARSRLERRDIQAVLRAIRRLDSQRTRHSEDREEAVVATSGEILIEDRDGDFERDSATDDDRVRTAIAWLEDAKLTVRDENRTSVFPSSLRVKSVDQARNRINQEGERFGIQNDARLRMVHVVRLLAQADPDKGITTDELMNECGCTLPQLRIAFSSLETLGIATNDISITVYIHEGVENSSQQRFDETKSLEKAMIDTLRETAPDLAVGEWTTVGLRALSQYLREQGHENPMPERLVRLLRSIAADGRDEPDALRSIEIRSRDLDGVGVRLRRTWDDIERLATLRREGAEHILTHLRGKITSGTRGRDLLVDSTYGELERCIRDDAELMQKLRKQNAQALVDRALLWMHEQSIITLNRGMTVFRPAMTLRVKRDGSKFTQADFEPLQQHYLEKTTQVHVVAEFARLGMADVELALRLAKDYFELDNRAFIEKWFKGQERTLRRETLPKHYDEIVTNLGNRVQERIVADERERTNVLVLAGPGSGKTRVLVHRIAYLIRVRREAADRILALTYNRHAAVQVRRRLHDLIGADARGVNVMTCHALALRILGISFADTANNPSDDEFDALLRQATELLRADSETSTFVSREQMIGRLSWILVDEYQDIGEGEFEFISALTGRTLADEDAKLNLFAVGDDDQNVYSFKGASVEYIRRFEQDYNARRDYLVENYRSTANIIDAANRCIDVTEDRLKRDQTLRVDSSRESNAPGGAWQTIDNVANGRVQILNVTGGQLTQAIAAVDELQRLSRLARSWRWDRCAIIARNWNDLDAAASVCRARDIPFQVGNEQLGSFWRVRETQSFLKVLETHGPTVEVSSLRRFLVVETENPWKQLLAQALEELLLEEEDASVISVSYVKEWLGEWSREIRRRQTGLLFTTAHSAKGLEFDHVAILDGKWNSSNEGEDADAPTRLFYVSMTRARQTLLILSVKDVGRSGGIDEPIGGYTNQRARILFKPLVGAASVLVRDAPDVDLLNDRFRERFKTCTMGDVWLDFAGRHSPGSAVHRAISALNVGDELSLMQKNGNWEIRDQSGQTIGQMARKWGDSIDVEVIDATVHGIFTRWKSDVGDEEYQGRLRSDYWEVVVPELKYAAN